MAGPIDPRTLAIIQAMEPAAAQRQAIVARDAVMRGSAPAPMQAGLRIAPAPQMGMDEFADVRNPIPLPRGPMTAPQPSAADLMPPQTAGRMQPMPQSFETPIGPAPSRFVPPAGNMLAPDIETGSVAPMPAPPPAPAPAGNRLATGPSPAPMPAPAEPAGNMLAAPTGRRVYDPAAGTNAPRFIYEGGPAPMRAAGGGSAIATGGGAVPATGGAGGAAMPYSGGDSGGGMGDGFFDFLGGFSRGGLLGGIQGVHLGKQARAKAGQSAQKQEQQFGLLRQAAQRAGLPEDMINATLATDPKALNSLTIDIYKQRMQPDAKPKWSLEEIPDENGNPRKAWVNPEDPSMAPIYVGGVEKAKPGWRDLTPDEVKARGLDPAKAWQVSPEGKLDVAGSGGVTVNTTVGGDDKFAGENAKNVANRFDAMAADGQTARATRGQIDILRENVATLPGGFIGAAQSVASDWGIKLGENASNVEAANAIISSLIPAQRIEGAGASSDRDTAIFRKSVPSLSNTPEGNALIMDTMASMADYKIAMGDIATAVQMGEIDRAEGLRQIKALPDPFARFKEYQADAGKADEAAAPSGGYAEGTIAENDKGQRVILQGGRWVPQPR
jgi:hypothetical protein